MASTYEVEQRCESEPGSLPDSTELYSAERENGQLENQEALEAGPRKVPVSWDKSVQLEVQGSGAGTLNIPKPLSSAASRSSVIDDLGNTRYLADNLSSNDVPVQSNRNSVASTEELVAHSGAGLTNTIEDVALREADLSNQGDAVPQDKNTGANSKTQVADRETLGESIRAAVISQAREKGKFLPNDALKRIVTRTRIREELDNHKAIPKIQLDSLTDSICEVKELRTKPRTKKTTRERIFAILGLIEKCGDIREFIRVGIYDSDLPFILSDGGHPGRPRLHRKGENDTLEPLPFLFRWRTHDHESFYSYQWQLLAPYFQLPTKQSEKVLHYRFENQITLPFIEDDEGRWGAGGAVGGFGDVWRVKIHPAHHNCCKDTANPDENPSYAVKRLRHNDPNAFYAEVSNLKRFSTQDHVHLIKLLVTFSWREQYYLMFPWADGNLLNFWKDLHPELSNPVRDHQLAVWFSKQCLGIAQGLRMIHTANVPSPDGIHNNLTNQTHGRHGDLKPENILWFKSYDGNDDNDFGVLKISDFGLTRFHRTMSKSHVEAVAVSPTYRPPEYDIARMVSQSFDVWSLGCVLLEFATWYLLGGQGVKSFSGERARDDTREMREDVFFNFVEIKEENGKIELGARAKLSVANEFQTLYELDNCSDFMLDLLAFIHDRLLRVSPKHRAKCEEIVTKFEALCHNCLNSSEYCMKKTKKTPERSGTALSELTASALHLSPAMTSRVRRASLPEHTGPLEEEPPPSQGPESPLPVSNEDMMDGLSLERSLSPEPLQGEWRPRSPDKKKGANQELPKVDTLGDRSYGNRMEHMALNHINNQSSRPQSPGPRVHFGQQMVKDGRKDVGSDKRNQVLPHDQPLLVGLALPESISNLPLNDIADQSTNLTNGSGPTPSLNTDNSTTNETLTDENEAVVDDTHHDRLLDQGHSDDRTGVDPKSSVDKKETAPMNEKGSENRSPQGIAPETAKINQAETPKDPRNKGSSRKADCPKNGPLSKKTSKRKRLGHFLSRLLKRIRRVK